MYNFLRANGFSTDDIVTVIQGHDKTHLIGANDKEPINAQHAVTLHHEWFINPWDRLPRLRAGNVHDYNIYVDDTLGLAAKRLRDARAAAMSSANANTLNNTYSFNPFLNGSISTEGGALLVEKSVYIDCLTPLRNNQTDPSDPTYTGKILGSTRSIKWTTPSFAATAPIPEIRWVRSRRRSFRSRGTRILARPTASCRTPTRWTIRPNCRPSSPVRRRARARAC